MYLYFITIVKQKVVGSFRHAEFKSGLQSDSIASSLFYHSLHRNSDIFCLFAVKHTFFALFGNIRQYDFPVEIWYCVIFTVMWKSFNSIK